ncbi:MAG: thiamine diphosphokinase, partial [Clostridia bacterium]|nr:thiamine diphosphokinase [Clostridia bacterium]
EQNVIYADAGYKFKDKVGVKNVLAVVGDFDSLKTAPKNENVIALDAQKNFTDGERAVRFAVEQGAKTIVIYGAYGGKIEHVLGNIALLKIAKDLGVNAYIKDGATITELIDKKGSTLSFIPYGGDCKFNCSSGLYYPLNKLTLTTADTRGISNVVMDCAVEYDIDYGQALVVYEK